jgi:hypothetical protein
VFGARFAAIFAACAIGMTGQTAFAQVPGIGQPVVPQTSSGPGDTSALAREATTWLADLIKINTTNPPGK